MKCLLLLSFIFISTNGQTQSLERMDLIKDPAISQRCKALLDKRKGKIQIQQRMNALLKRNIKILKTVPEQKETLRSKLEFTQTRIKNQIRLSKISNQKLEETIVRRGCPGVSL
ncbi:MAG: hypothetical protein KC478_17575 [Bacteriovoracaceae bacterium]|nr:hypothetical protein [Bacteriovoracaceae bacterium]